jgi:hypothetical protein
LFTVICVKEEVGLPSCNGSHVADVSFENRFPTDENASSDKGVVASRYNVRVEADAQEIGRLGFHTSGEGSNLSMVSFIL